MAAILKVWVMIEIRLRQSMHIYLKNNPAKFHPDLIWNDGTLFIFEDGHPNKKNNNNANKMSSDRYKISSWSKIPYRK